MGSITCVNFNTLNDQSEREELMKEFKTLTSNAKLQAAKDLNSTRLKRVCVSLALEFLHRDSERAQLGLGESSSYKQLYSLQWVQAFTE